MDAEFYITEEQLDEYFKDELPDNHDLMPGCNIKTSLYGLFLIFEDLRLQPPLIHEAIAALDTIPDCTIFTTLAMHYPPEDLSPKGIVRLAKAVVVIGRVTRGKKAERVPVNVGTALELKVSDILGLSLKVRKVA
jgi:hypothetical protein